MNARQKRLFEEALKRNPDLKIPSTEAAPDWTEADLALIKQGVGDKTSRPAQAAAEAGDASGEAPSGEQPGSVVTYFEAKGFGFLRPDDGGRDIFFHVSRLAEGLATDLRPGTRVLYELGMDRTGKMAASSIRIAPQEA
ncbi:MAG TPA: cold shock domain-containing protein [Candidatus Limnocylindrales bacterium]|nr:cold shock domain-containing protein [Candidatus Limnocylindrales bacterium]